VGFVGPLLEVGSAAAVGSNPTALMWEATLQLPKGPGCSGSDVGAILQRPYTHPTATLQLPYKLVLQNTGIANVMDRMGANIWAC
jgi:hypothetical protein